VAQDGNKNSKGKSGGGKSGSGNSGSGSSGSGSSGGGPGPNRSTPKGGPAPKGTPARKPAGRQSVAAARKSSNGTNRTQLIIGAVAIVVILVIVVAGVVITKNQSEVQAEGYGGSTQSVATASADGVVTVAKPGATPKVTIDVFEDALCPICSAFETQFGQQISQEIDSGSLAVNFHMLNFLNASSFSGDYSTRAAAALLCVAQESGSQPGLYMAYHSALFNSDNQPAEQGTEDLTNEQLASLATSVGAPAAATTCISSGQNVDAAAASAATSSATLSAATGQVATPTVLVNGAPVKQLTTDWLTTLLAQS
jgi:protein-disulfide isomerase